MSLRRRIVDYHVHSTHSSDGRSSILDLCQKAVGLGIAEVGFSEHVDFDPVDRGFGFFDYESYASDVERARELFGDRLVIRKGVEIDYQQCFMEEIKAWLRNKQFDFTIGSVHYIDHEIMSPRKVACKDLRKTYDAYLDEVTNSVESGLFDVVGHFDFVRLYAGNRRFELDDPSYRERAKRILKRIVEKKTHLEVNTKGLRDRYNETIPSREIVTEYIENGGRLISIGSDAHSVEEIGNGVKEILGYLARYDERQVRLLF